MVRPAKLATAQVLDNNRGISLSAPPSIDHLQAQGVAGAWVTRGGLYRRVAAAADLTLSFIFRSFTTGRATASSGGSLLSGCGPKTTLETSFYIFQPPGSKLLRSGVTRAGRLHDIISICMNATSIRIKITISAIDKSIPTNKYVISKRNIDAVYSTFRNNAFR